MTEQQINEKALEAYPEDKLTAVENVNRAKRGGYIKALKEIESLPKIKGWVARDECGLLFYRKKPYRYDGIFYSHWTDEYGPNSEIPLDDSLFPELTWEDEPIEVELIIRKV